MSDSAEAALPKFIAHYDSSKKTYWILDDDLSWIEVNESSLKRHLKAAGLNPTPGKNDLVSEVEAQLNAYQLGNSVQYSGPLSGHLKGIHTVCGQRVLVTASPVIPAARAGEWPVLREMIFNLLHDDDTDQQAYFFGWIKIAWEALRSNTLRPGQVLAIAGPRHCGKSLLQNLITEILGGRSAKPYRYMSGMTQFNGDLFGAEHLMIEDEAGSSDLRVRREFGARIKDFTVNEVQSCHSKNRPAISLRPFWRLSISLNDEDENLMVLPPIDESLADKIILLKSKQHQMPMETETIEGRKLFWQKLTSEIPAFLHFITTWNIPNSLRCQRFGISSYLHPELLSAIDTMAPETRLLSLLDEVLFEDLSLGQTSIELSSIEVERRLTSSKVAYEAKKILSWNNACGSYLGRLAIKKPDRIESVRTPSERKWKIMSNGYHNGQV
jgi:hypothetical protein